MAYFSNGTEGMMYQEKYCQRCIHDIDSQCPILALHLMWNYEAIKDPIKSMVLDSFIPRTRDGLSNEQCKMYHRFTDDECKTLQVPSQLDEAEKLKAWNEGRGKKIK